MLKSKMLLRILANSLLGVVLIYLWTRFVNVEETFAILKTVQLKFALLFFVFFIISTLLRALRLKILLGDKRLTLKDLSLLNVLSQFLSFMVPIRLGEVAKGIYLTSRLDVSLGKTLTWVFVDRFLDFWVILLLISFFLISTPTVLPANIAKSAFLAFGVFSFISILMISSQSWAKRLINLLGMLLVFKSPKEKVVHFSYTIIEGFEVLRRHPLELGLLVVLTVLACISDSMIMYYSFLSIGKNLGLGEAILGTSVSALTFLVPAAPGYVGSAEAGLLAVFGGMLGIEANIVSAASVIFHVLTIIALFIGGLSALYLLKFNLGLVWKRVRGG